MPKNNLLGFLFIEILIYLTILSILTTLGFTALSHWGEHAEEQRSSLELLQVIKLAQQYAQLYQSGIGLCGTQNLHCSHEWIKAHLVFLDIHENGNITSQSQILLHTDHILKYGFLRQRSFPSYRNYLLFTPPIWGHSDNASIWYCNKKDKSIRWIIRVNQLGQGHLEYRNKLLKASQDETLKCG